MFRVIPDHDRLNPKLFPFSRAEMSVTIVDANGDEMSAPRTADTPELSALVSDVDVTPGETYFVLVSGGSGVVGKYSLHVMSYNMDDYRPLMATQFALRLPNSVPNGLPVLVRVVALDARNRPVLTYTGSATVTSSDAGATLPASITFREGHAVFPVIFATAGEQTLTVTDSDNAALTDQAATLVVVRR